MATECQIERWYYFYMREISKLQADYARERDAREFSLGDTLDVKTSVILAVIVFLATQSEHFFESTLNSCMRELQYLSVVALVLGGIFAVIELVPRDYAGEGPPSSYDTWVRDLETYYAGKENADALIVEEAIKGRVAKATERIETNIAINKRKSQFLYLCFICTTVSLAANLLTLI